MQETSNKMVSAVVVAGGKRDYLESCLESLRNQTHRNLEIIIVDNSLDRNLGQEIGQQFPEIKLYLFEQENLYYAGGLNKGIGLSGGDFVLCLNDDIILDRQYIQQALRGFYQDACVGMVSGRILRRDGATLDSTGLFLSPWRTAKERGYGEKDRGQYNRPGYIFGVGGAAAFYRRAMLEQVKVGEEYFDSDFRMFYEDLDIAWRANLFGWRAYYIPQAAAYHIRGGTARRGPGVNRRCARAYIDDELHLDLIKNRYLAIIKNESFRGFLLNSLSIFFYDILTLGYILFRRPRLLKGLFLNLRYLKTAFRKRAVIKKSRRRK